MAKKKNTPAPQTDAVPQASSVQQSAADIPVQDLKARFQARSIPLETDFADLIDVADCGRKAVGMSPDFTPVSNTGLVLDSTTGQLKVKPDPEKGMVVSNGGVGVNFDNSLCITTADQLSVSDYIYSRQHLSKQVTLTGMSFAVIGIIQPNTLNAYARFHIYARDVSGLYNYSQRFIFTLSCDGGYQLDSSKSYSMSVTNSYVDVDVNHYVYADIRLSHDATSNVNYLTLHMPNPLPSHLIEIGMDYALSDISGIEVINFEYQAPYGSVGAILLNCRVDGSRSGN